jgi:hypothetical protein
MPIIPGGTQMRPQIAASLTRFVPHDATITDDNFKALYGLMTRTLPGFAYGLK